MLAYRRARCRRQQAATMGRHGRTGTGMPAARLSLQDGRRSLDDGEYIRSIMGGDKFGLAWRVARRHVVVNRNKRLNSGD